MLKLNELDFVAKTESLVIKKKCFFFYRPAFFAIFSCVISERKKEKNGIVFSLAYLKKFFVLRHVPFDSSFKLNFT